jgi:Patatin-like phospholipase
VNKIFLSAGSIKTMPEEATEQNGNEILLPKILREELNHIRSDSVQTGGGRTAENLNEVFDDFHKAELSALCFSGGGIRSATFGLGIVQALAKYKLLDNFDYLSTVSGGGYLGSWLSAWIRREQMRILEDGKFNGETPQNTSAFEKENTKLFDDYRRLRDEGVKAVQGRLNKHTMADASCPNTEPKQLQYLREYSNYMSPRVGLLSADTWTFLAIYARNLLLNWTIFIPLICAILLIPRILLTLVNLNVGGTGLSLMLGFGLLAGIVSVVYTVYKLPSKNTDRAAIKYNNDFGVFITVILPLLLMAFGATTFWVWYVTSGESPDIIFEWFRPLLKSEKGNFIIFSVLVFLVGNVAFTVFKKFKSKTFKVDWREFLSAILSSAFGGALTWLLSYVFFNSAYFSDPKNHPYYLLIYVCLAVPLYLICFTISSTFFVGLYSRVATDDDREWLARQGAWVLIVCGAWIVLNGLVLFGPIVLEITLKATANLFSGKASDWIDYFSPIFPIIAAISGFLSLVGGFSGKSKVRDESAQSNLSRFLSVAPKIAAVIFLAFIFIGLAYVSSIALFLVGNSLKTNWSAFGSYLHSDVLYQSSITYLFVWLLVLSAVGVGMACFVNVNKFSLHAAYRDRLIRAYLGASHVKRTGNPFTGFDDSDNFQMHRLKGQKPFHIINATLNLIAGNKLAWQNRKAASFTMSPLHCGSWLLGYRHSNEYCRNTNLLPCKHLRYCNQRENACASVKECQLPGKALRLGTAMTISGAAANPNMGYFSSPVVTFLMSLFNIRLGWWLGNTGKKGDDKDWWDKEFYTKPSPSIAVLPLLNETLGQTDEDKHFLNVTDGGHFENLGLYEMVLRRCKLIVLSDAAADENFTFGEISNAIEKCKVDLGVDIKFNDGINIYPRNKAKDYAETRQLFAIAEIIYPERNHRGKNCKGHLLYIRPTFYGDESTDIKHYANANKTFPHQSTSDQLYDEKQFEAYRALGFRTMERIMGSRQHNNLSDLMNILREDGIQKD